MPKPCRNQQTQQTCHTLTPLTRKNRRNLAKSGKGCCKLWQSSTLILVIECLILFARTGNQLEACRIAHSGEVCCLEILCWHAERIRQDVSFCVVDDLFFVRSAPSPLISRKCQGGLGRCGRKLAKCWDCELHSKPSLRHPATVQSAGQSPKRCVQRMTRARWSAASRICFMPLALCGFVG